VFSGELVRDLNCLKYEVRRLKADAASSTVLTEIREEVTSFRRVVSGMANDVKCLKYETRRLKNRALLPDAPLYLGSGVDRHDVDVLKRDVRRLQHKEQPGAADPALRADADDLKANAARDGKVLQQLVRQVAALPVLQHDERIDQLVHGVRCLKYAARRAKHNTGADTSPEGGREVWLLRRDVGQLVRSVRCLKFEVRKLKQNGGEVPGPERAPVTVPEDIMEWLRGEMAVKDQTLLRLEQSFASISAVTREANFGAVAHDVKCLKYELKRLLASKPGAPSAVVQNIIEAVRGDLEEVVRTEVRKQAGQTQRSDEVLERAVVPFTGIGGLDLGREVGLLKRAVEDLRAQVNAGPSSPEVTQIFVDLPEAEAVRLIFRAQ
jgi:hypothetical protein